MLCRVDWISFTAQADTAKDATTEAPWRQALAGVGRLNPGLRKWLEAEGQFQDGGGRAPFKKSLRIQNCGVTIFYGHKKNLVLCEISGQGCQRLRELNGEEKTLEKVKNHLTRIDIAVDWLTDVTPMAFAELRDGNRFKSGGVLNSETGDTVYVGSRMSDRYARVYKYKPPHPRSHMLRCEMVLRDEQASAAAAYILEHGLQSAANSIGAVFGWSHELWTKESDDSEALKAYRPVDRGGGTVRWLHTQVLPAIERLLEEGQQQSVNEFVAKIAKISYDYSQRSTGTHEG